MPARQFLTKEQEQHIIEAIAEAEENTTGEIRVHIEHHCNQEPLKRAAYIFHELGMDETRRKNGVLIYIATEDHKAAVYAGKAIHEQVENHFWNDVLKILIDHFKKDEYEEGLIDAVIEVGKKIKELYPSGGGDLNELPDEISFHANKKS